MPNSLIPIESVNSIELFTDGGLDKLLAKIKKEVAGLVPDLDTAKGRKEIASTARKVASSKVVIDNAGKELVADWKGKAKVVDESRRHARTFLDALRDEVRQPLTDYETEQLRIAEEKRKAEEINQAHIEAIAEDVLFERELELKRKEAEIERQNVIRRQEEHAKQMAKEKAERDERIRLEGEERAKREAEEAIHAEREKVERAEREAKEAKERAEQEAKQAEKDRIVAAQNAEREKQDAIRLEQQEAADRAAAVERARLQQDEEKRREDERRAANKKHRTAVNNRILDALKSEGLSVKDANAVITAVATGAIPDMTIRY